MNEENSRNDLWVKLSDVERILNTSCVKSEILYKISKCAKQGTGARAVVKLSREDVLHNRVPDGFIDMEISKRLAETIMNGFGIRRRCTFDMEWQQYEYSGEVIVIYPEEE